MPIENKNNTNEKLDNINYTGEINDLKNKIDLSYLKDYISKNIMDKDRKMDIRDKINGKEVYYVPIEDGKGNIVKYNIMYINKDNGSEIIKLPIFDTKGNLLRIESIARYIPMTKPMLDPIDFVSLGGGIAVSFLNGLKTLAPKAGINLSKTAVVNISKSELLLSIIGEELPKDIVGNVVTQGLD